MLCLLDLPIATYGNTGRVPLFRSAEPASCRTCSPAKSVDARLLKVASSSRTHDCCSLQVSEADIAVRAASVTLLLTTIRSHDQYNTTVYGMNDRYRGVFGRRDLILMNADDLAQRGLKNGDRIDVASAIDGSSTSRRIEGYTAVAYDIPRGSIAGYYPELNVVMAFLARNNGSAASPGAVRKFALPFPVFQRLEEAGTSSRNPPGLRTRSLKLWKSGRTSSIFSRIRS